ncbi:MAG: VWA domain-containing protein [candidate division WS1 bacterium]|nr:VWA domain-containing protein [candidate division WS1 bacterium]
MIRRLVLCGAVLIVFATCVAADGILIPGPPERPIPDVPYFTIKYHHVDVAIRDQVATTKIDQVFVNEASREVEATYLFPLPPGSVVRDFAVEADGQRMETQLLEADEAQRIYEDIMRRRRDPALFQYAGNNTYRARIYPIPAGGERRIEITYSELLTQDAGVVQYTYPLSTERFSHELVRETVVNCTIASSDPIASVYSPSHDISLSREGRRDAKVSYEENNTRPDRDLQLYYTVSQDAVGMHLLTHKERGEDGFFMLLAAPSLDMTTDPLPKNVVFVLDRSGSMSGEKIVQARDALTFCVNQLGREDSFEVITFSDHVRSLGDSLQEASPDRVRAARDFIRNIEAAGSTDINSAMELAMERRSEGRPNYIVTLTDGLPTAGVTDLEKILSNVKELREEVDASTRVFVFGVGYDVDTHFLDRMSLDNGGVAAYVRPEESIEAKVSSFYSKISRPMLTDIGVHFDGITTFDLLPRELPDLFYGSQIVALGRYDKRTTGACTVTLSGQTPEGSASFEVETNFPERDISREYIPPLWAARKVGWLLDEIRLNGEKKELVDEIVRLGTEYGILTEYTSFLATEQGELTEDAVARRLTGPGGAMGPAGPLATERMGGYAISQRDNAQAMQKAESVAAQNMYQDAEGNWQRVGNIRNIGQRGFIQQGEQWVDSRLRVGSEEELEPGLRVQAFSEAHFQLSRAFPALNAQLSVAEDMLVLINGHVVQIGAEGDTTLTADQLRMLELPAGDEVGQIPTRPESRLGVGLLDYFGTMLAGVSGGIQKYFG